MGFGQDSISSLLGNIGDQDVKDVKASTVINTTYMSESSVS